MNNEIQGETWEASNDDYHAADGVSNSRLNDFVDDPLLYAHYYVWKDWQRPEGTASMDFGTDVHELLPPSPTAKIVTIPASVLNADGHRKGKAWKDFELAHGPECLLLKAAEAEPYMEIIKRVTENPAAMEMLDTPIIEQNFRWKDERTGLLLKCRWDRLKPGAFIGDIKSTKAKNRTEWQNEVYRHGYHRQAALYQRGAFVYTGDLLPFRHLPCRNSRPYTAEVIELDDDFIELGNQELDALLDRLLKCLETDNWECEGHGTVLTASPPEWALRQIKQTDFYNHGPTRFADAFTNWVGGLQPLAGE